MEHLLDEKIRGVTLKAKVKWAGEKSRTYFFNLEKRNAINKNVNKLKVDNIEIHNSKHILQKEFKFFSKLYGDNNNKKCNNIKKFFDISRPKLSVLECESCEGVITNEECVKVIKELKTNKSPGNDGLTSEFYKIFLWEINNIVLESYNYAYQQGQLATSQSQAVITLIAKSGKNNTLLQNWRPISLFNTDYKILLKALSTRLIKVLPSIIGEQQYGFIKIDLLVIIVGL